MDTNINNNDISLYLGEPLPIISPSYLSQMGWEQIMVIVNQGNGLSQLSSSEIQSVYTGQTSKWDNDAGQPIQVWVLTDGDPVRMLFDRAVLKSSRLTSEAMLAPDPEAMLEAISSDTNAIGYLPGSALSSSDPSLVAQVKVIQLEQLLQDELHPPVIALTQNEPDGLVRELLLCVQAAPP
jgi:phosphate transport system substrate-binding protein